MKQEIELKRRMAAWRAHSGLSLQKVADLAGGVSKQKISYVENGDQSITVETLDRVCRKAFKTDLHTFFGELPS